MTGLLRGELGFTGVIISDALEMKAVSDPFGIPGAAVMAVTAGADLLCLGRDTSQEVYQAVVAALSDAVREGRLSGQRLEDAADRVAALRAWLATGAASRPAVPPVTPGGPAGGAVDGGRTAEDGTHVGLSAARRALRLSGPRPVLADPVIIEVVPRENVAVGQAAWGLEPWARPGSVRRFPATGMAAEALDAAAGRSLVIVVRDAHCSENTRALLTAVLAERPDAVVVEMGLPVWQPPPGTCQAYLATYGASRANAQAAAEILGLT
jgi:beta-N-acetylhexosaminidase